MPAEPPADFARLLAEAGDLFEDHDFAGAVRTYRAAAGLAPLPDWAFDNLAWVEREEAIEFRRAIARQFPDSLDVALAEVRALSRARYRTQAIARCSEILGRSGLTDREVRSVRATRLQAAGDDPATFLMDFANLWNTPGPHLERRRLILLRAIVEIDQPRMIDALATIADRLGADADLARIIATKVEQLTLLSQLKAALPPIRRPEPGEDQP